MSKPIHTIAIPGIAALYAERIAAAQEDTTLAPVQLWLPCVSGGQDTTTGTAARVQAGTQKARSTSTAPKGKKATR